LFWAHVRLVVSYVTIKKIVPLVFQEHIEIEFMFLIFGSIQAI
jgi:hypothetical protein